MGFLGIPDLSNPGIGDENFSFWARSKNSRRFEISEVRIGDSGSRKIPSEKITRKSPIRLWDFWGREIFNKNPWKFPIPEMGIFKICGFLSRDLGLLKNLANPGNICEIPRIFNPGFESFKNLVNPGDVYEFPGFLSRGLGIFNPRNF